MKLKKYGFAPDYGISDLATRAAAVTSRVDNPFSYMTGNSFVPGPGVQSAEQGVGAAAPAPNAPAPGAPPDTLTIPGPNYEALIEATPEYQSWEQSSQRSLADAASQRKAALRALVLQYGGLPSGISDTYKDLTDADIQAGKDNPYSQEAQLARSYQQNSLNMKRALAARGALHSGDLGYEQNQIDTERGQSESNLANSFSNALAGAIGDYLGVVHQEGDNRGTAVGQAYQDIIQNPLYQQGAGGQASLVSDWQTKYGKPVYQDAVGNLYTVGDGNVPIPYYGN